MAIKILQVDAFTSEPFSGNPAAVCLLEEPRDDGWMQKVAAEMNLSETAFMTPEGDGFRLRWFAPKAEVELCGHATLASAHLLWEEGVLAEDEIARFATKSGPLFAERRGGFIEMDFPAEPERPIKCSPPMLEAALGAPFSYVGDNRFDLLVELDGEETLRELRPNFDLLKKIPVRGVMVTAESDSPEYDFVSRFFAPTLGVDEDPVTGSAHCCLGPYWARRLGKFELVGYQASERGGVVRVRGGEDGDRVKIGGEAVTVLKGELIEG
ncbi:PhzF family phenazine biosynthesis protein [Methanothrix harundinacea]|uniref:Phenazine biosynthesis protein PhzF family n=1 Tax=Methanothrix harundinacea (strain 6Ac) TaxID=1110509 RepID=G7WKL1_METH6|nr:PhzF family phenazine biosynthesis protein [Methanothrix harundinacea]AET63490.1 Phenazine biosynthesis protein PhzF family [Methanothrix harundinacea 6Ac]